MQPEGIIQQLQPPNQEAPLFSSLETITHLLKLLLAYASFPHELPKECP